MGSVFLTSYLTIRRLNILPSSNSFFSIFILISLHRSISNIFFCKQKSIFLLRDICQSASDWDPTCLILRSAPLLSVLLQSSGAGSKLEPGRGLGQLFLEGGSYPGSNIIENLTTNTSELRQKNKIIPSVCYHLVWVGFLVSILTWKLLSSLY